MTARRIVLVEDDDSLRLVAQLTMESIGGHTVLALPSGEDAVEQAAPFDPELLVLDVSMPGMDGPATLEALRKQPALIEVPAIFLTANTQAAQVASYLALGASDVVAKPFDPQELCARIDAIFDKPAQASPPAGPRALLVEDDPGIRFLVKFVLEQQGWQVSEAVDGDAAVLALQGPPASVVLLDIMLPGVDGLELLERLRSDARWDAVPVMMLTAKRDEPSLTRALSNGADDYLVKPFDPQELTARLGRLKRVSSSS